MLKGHPWVVQGKGGGEGWTPCTLQTRAANINPYNGHTLLLSMDVEQVRCVRGAKRKAKREKNCGAKTETNAVMACGVK